MTQPEIELEKMSSTPKPNIKQFHLKIKVLLVLESSKQNCLECSHEFAKKCIFIPYTEKISICLYEYYISLPAILLNVFSKNQKQFLIHDTLPRSTCTFKFVLAQYWVKEQIIHISLASRLTQMIGGSHDPSNNNSIKASDYSMLN